MSNTNLKKLFTEYTNGLITIEEYRHRRTQIIDEITGEITVRNDDFSPPTIPSYQVPQFENEPEPVSSNPIKTPKKVTISIIGGFLLLVIATVIIAYKFNYHSTADVENKSEHPKQHQNINSNSSDFDISQIASSLLQHEQWNSQDINTFIIEWNKLNYEQRYAALTSSWYRDLKDMINRRILEQRALADIGDKNAVKLEKLLQNLAETLDTANK